MLYPIESDILEKAARVHSLANDFLLLGREDSVEAVIGLS